MGEDKFDVIIVGGGIAGSIAAHMLAEAGLEVVVIERGNSSGSKNMTGGRLYSHSLEKIIPNFADVAPVERKVTKERISMLTDDSAFTIDFSSGKLGDTGKNSYVILRGQFDRWLAEEAENNGAMYIYGIRVDDLIVKDGKVCGVVAGDEEMLADVVILADGVNSLLAQKLGMKKELSPHEVAVGAKEVIEFDEKTIKDRFNLNGDDGLAWLFAGAASAGHIGGGFLYTNKTSISLGIVTTVGDIDHSDKSVPEMIEDFKNHPVIQPLIEGGKLIEYSAHLVPEGGYDTIPTLYKDGVVVVGDAANLVINIGYMVRGMDLAVESGKLAAETILKAKEKNDFSANALSSYQAALEASFVMKDLRHYKKFPHFMENHRIFNEYPEMIDDIMANMFIVDGSEPRTLLSKVMNPAKKVGLMTLVKDGFKGVRSL